MAKKIKHKVFVNKNMYGIGGYSVTEMTFDKDGSTVNHYVHAKNLSYRAAHDLKKEILACYE